MNRPKKKQDQIQEKQASIAKVLLPDDFPVYGLSAMARVIGRSRQWLRYGLQHHHELEFVQRSPLHAMMSELQNFNCQLIEIRVRQEQQDRGKARGKENKRPQMWHLYGPERPPVMTTPLYRPGQKALFSGVYEIINVSGVPVGQTRPIDAGSVFPPVPNRGEQYRLKQEVNPLFTSAASKVAIDEITSTFAAAIKHLADR